MPFHGTLPAHHERYPDLSSRLARSDRADGLELVHHRAEFQVGTERSPLRQGAPWLTVVLYDDE